jgi:hypothetical protein
LERQWDKSLTYLNFPDSIEPWQMQNTKYRISGGNGEYYRIRAWPRASMNMHYINRTLIGKDMSTLSLGRGLGKGYISIALSQGNSDQSGILTVYPNPAEEYIIIRAGHSNGISEPYQIELSDAMGRRQIIGQIQSGMSVQYPTTTLSSGLYTVRLLQPAQKTVPIVQVMIIK